MIKKDFLCNLTLKELILSVRLGCHPHEMEKDQLVSVTIDISFKTLPIGAISDDLTDTICYSKLAKHLQSFVKDKRFSLLEKFSKDLHACICDFLLEGGYEDAIVIVTSHKMLSQASPIKGGVLFTYAGGIA